MPGQEAFTIDHAKIGKSTGIKLGNAGIHGWGETEEYIVRDKEIWHRYKWRFEDQYPLDAIAMIFERYIDPVMIEWYKTSVAVILKVEVAIVDEQGKVIAEGTRSVTAMFEYDEVTKSIEFNVKNWLSKGEYDAVLGMILEVRAPSWYEKRYEKQLKGANK